MISNVKATKGIGDNVLKKTIHEGSESIMFSVLQETQYMYPFKSSVREIVSNSLDSINEKVNALKILREEIKIEDLFIEKEGEEFKDSRFNAEYYDKKWLSDSLIVKIRYIENDSPTRDRIQFVDEGVGLGGNRLVNYFSLGFSTKRLSKSQLGSFGLGAKSLLATGVDFYTVTSRYNGKLFKFNVFKDHVASVIPKFKEDGTKNKVEKFYNGFECHYEVTNDKNGVIVEAEVKRHRKQDYLNSISNQLGFIDNVQLLISDKEYGIVDNKRDIKSNILYKTDKILVGDTDYYARPQILLRPGADSNIYINYGPINFDELEMKRYSGNVSFIMNINEVDVTPSRESVIWNTKTRDAIKNMFIEAQNTILDIIQERIKGATSLSEHLNMLETFKNKNSVSGLSELYKVIDVSTLELGFRTFNISKAGLEMKDEKDFLFTSTGKVNSYGWNNPMKDSDFSSKLSKKYLSYLSPLNNNFKGTVVYIGGTRYKDLARYVKKKYVGSNFESVNIVFFKTERFEKVQKEIGVDLTSDDPPKWDPLTKYLEEAYVKEEQTKILYGEVFLAIKNGLTVLHEDAIDKAEMRKIAEVDEKVDQNRYMSAAERAKLENKVSCYTFKGSYKHKDYYSEETLNDAMLQGKKVILYKTNDPINTALTVEKYGHGGNIFDNILIVGCSEENFKRFIKVEGVQLLTDSLYNIEYGDISLTRLGEYLLDSYTRDKLQNKELKDSVLAFLSDSFANLKLEDKKLTAQVDSMIHKIKQKRRRRMQEIMDNNK